MSWRPNHMVLSGRFGIVLGNQAMLGTSIPFTQVTSTEQFMNKVLEWYNQDPFIKNKVVQIQLRVEKLVTQDQRDVSYLSIYRFPNLDHYKHLIKVCKKESEFAFKFKMLNLNYKPNHL